MQIPLVRNIFPDISVARYNMAAWTKKDSDHTVLVGREVIKPGNVGEPDIGTLVLAELDDKGAITHERTVWQPSSDNLYLEDPRALVLSDGSTVLCLTALLKNSEKVTPYPAIVKVDADWDGVLPPVTVIESLGPGKNLTPFTHTSFLFRPEKKAYFHKLLAFELVDLLPKKICDIQFPTDISWAQWRIGTTIPPIWVSDDQAILLFHGINIIDGKYVYSIGAAKLLRSSKKFEVEVYKEPFITPDILQSRIPAVRELRPSERKVVYSCGGIVKEESDSIFLYVNVGDCDTYEVCLSLSEIKQQLHF